MTDFAKKTRNVHKELKDTLMNTGTVLNQYVKIRSSTSKNKEIKNTRTQTEEVPTENIQPENSHRRKVETTDVSTDTPCWWPTLLEREPGPTTIHLHSQQPQQNKEEHGDGEEFTVVNRKRTVRRQQKDSASVENPRQIGQDTHVQRESRRNS